MIVLVDSHVLLWAVLDDRSLSQQARELWLDQGNQLLVSSASLWEIAIKVGIGKLAVDRPLLQFFTEEIEKNLLSVLQMSPAHAAHVAILPRHHGDPFDRMLVAQALVENVPLLSADQQLDAYGVQRIW